MAQPTQTTPATQRPFETAGLTAEQLLGMYEKMLAARLISQTMLTLQRQGRIVFAVSCEGHEAAQVASASCLTPGKDWVVPYYRDVGVALALGMTAKDVMLGAFSRRDDPSSGGRQMACHFSSTKLHILSGSSPVSTQISHAVGVALAAKIRRQPSVAVAYFGDGAASKGEFHEGLNFAGVHRLPVIFFCENNDLAISTQASKQRAIERLSDRAAAYGFPGVTVDGMDVVETYVAMKEAVERARAGHGPTLVEAKVYRYSPHTSNDDDHRYRTREDVQVARKRDPIPRLRAQLLDWGVLSEAQAQDVELRVKQWVETATREAEQSPPPEPGDATLRVYASGGQ